MSFRDLRRSEDDDDDGVDLGKTPGFENERMLEEGNVNFTAITGITVSRKPDPIEFVGHAGDET